MSESTHDVTLPNGERATLHISSRSHSRKGYVYASGRRVYGRYVFKSVGATDAFGEHVEAFFTPSGKYAHLVNPQPVSV